MEKDWAVGELVNILLARDKCPGCLIEAVCRKPTGGHKWFCMDLAVIARHLGVEVRSE